MYYSSHPHTKNLIYFEYRPAIAEVNLLDTFRVTHCDSFLKIESAFYEKIVTNGKYIAIDHTQRAYMDFSPYKEVYNDVIEQMDIYPFVNIHFLDIKTNGFILKTDSSEYIIYHPARQYIFNKLDYSLIGYRDVDLSNYGLGIKSYKIAASEDIECNGPADLSFLKKYKEQTISDKDVKVSKLEGKQVSDLLTSQHLKEIYNQPGDESKWVLLDLFYQSCYPCILGFKSMRAKGLDTMRSKIKIIGVDYMERDAPTLNKFMKRYKLDFSLVTGQTAGELKSLFNPNGIAPVYVLISPKGKIIKIAEGFDEKFFDRIIKRIKTQE